MPISRARSRRANTAAVRSSCGTMNVGAPRRCAQRVEEGPSRIRAAWPEAQRALASRKDARQAGRKRENWLLIKGDDEFARATDEADILEERPELINTGRTIDELEGEAPGWSSKTGKIENPDGAGAAAKPSGSGSGRSLRKRPRSRTGSKAPLPGFVEPMLATLTKSPPTGNRWLHDIKFDGYRLQAHIEEGRDTLRTGVD